MKKSDYNRLSKQEKKSVKFKDLPLSKKLVKIGLIVGLILFISYWFQQITDDNSKKSSIDEIKQGAFFVVHDFVKDNLKAPATADFIDDDHLWNYGDSIYIIKGSVDAENSFGAKLRSKFFIKIRYKCCDPYQKINWELVEVSIE